MVLLPKYVFLDTVVKPSCAFPRILPLYFFLIVKFPSFSQSASLKALLYVYFVLYSFNLSISEIFFILFQIVEFCHYFWAFLNLIMYSYYVLYIIILSSFWNRSLFFSCEHLFLAWFHRLYNVIFLFISFNFF